MAAERIDFEIKVFDNFIEITPKDGVLDNSIYEIRLKDLKQDNGNKVLPNTIIKVCTQLTPAYTTINAVNSLISSCNIEEDVILYHIREASRFVEYVTGQTYKSKAIPFEVDQYVKYKAAHECLMKFYVEMASEGGQKGTLGDVNFETKTQFHDISNLLKSLKAEAAAWYDEICGYKNAGRAKPLSAVKSSNIILPRMSNETPPKRTDWSDGK